MLVVSESSGSKLDLPEKLVQVLPPILSNSSMWPARSHPLHCQHVSTCSNQSRRLYAPSSPTRTPSSPTSTLRWTPSTPPSPKPPISSLKPDQHKESLLKENASLSNTVRKLSRDVSKLEVFRRTLLQSLQEDEDNSGGAPDIVAKLQSQASITSTSQLGDDDALLLPSRSSSMQTYISDTGNSFAEDLESDAGRPRVPHNLILASQTSTPRITPPGSPPSLSATVSPTRTSKPVSPRRHSISFSTSRGMSHGSMSSSDTGSQTGRTRVDGKEFFRQVRSSLSYEQFGAFLANVKELNSHKQTKGETLEKADEIFGPENKDLYAIFKGLIARNVH